ncbi:hypothetical protein JXB02_04925 [Candidatus Woesearchaeota archaeon]|nr:hypothetical protein [Candidatus Woesearchaeota archaeon]
MVSQFKNTYPIKLNDTEIRNDEPLAKVVIGVEPLSIDNITRGDYLVMDLRKMKELGLPDNRLQYHSKLGTPNGTFFRVILESGSKALFSKQYFGDTVYRPVRGIPHQNARRN